jgi:hypothetical protein
MCGDDVVVTAGSLVAAILSWRPSPGNTLIGPGMAMDENLLVEVTQPAPRPVPWPEDAATRLVLQVPLELLDYGHQLVPAPPGEVDTTLPVLGVTRSGAERTVEVPGSTMSTIGWLDPFCVSPLVDPAEALFLGVGAEELYWWGSKSSLRTPRLPVSR